MIDTEFKHAIRFFDNIVWCFDNPSVDEIKKASIATSHFVCMEGGESGHEKRQKIRRFLCKRRGIIYEYKAGSDLT